MQQKIEERNFSYKVEIDAVNTHNMSFDSISGLGFEQEILIDQDATTIRPKKDPGLLFYNNIVIHNILIEEESPIEDWIDRWIAGVEPRRAMSIVIFVLNQELRRFNCFECFPVGITYHEMRSGKALYADVEIAIGWIERA